jgi:hypothetical protein
LSAFTDNRHSLIGFELIATIASRGQILAFVAAAGWPGDDMIDD